MTRGRRQHCSHLFHSTTRSIRKDPMTTIPTPRYLPLAVAATLSLGLAGAVLPAVAAGAADPPAGTTVTVTGLGTGTPGVLQTATVLVEAPDGDDAGSAPDPVAGQEVVLSLDHGFFSTGEPAVAPVVGEQAGAWEQQGSELTVTTDTQGRATALVGIERDEEFDDDGAATAVLTAVAGSAAPATGEDEAVWSTANPLNGGVRLDLSPAGEQVGPTSPSLAGNRTYFEVLATDQFGNPVDGQTLDLAYDGDLDDWDYSDDVVDPSDLDTNGDIWVVSFEPGTIEISAAWVDAPTTLYTDSAGAVATGTAEATGSAEAAFYAVDFARSRVTMASSATDTVLVGSTVTQTVTVVDQLGNPVPGLQVQFLRFGPDNGGGEARVTRTTSARGQASYTFVGSQVGTARVTGRVSDTVDGRSVAGVVRFGSRVTARLAETEGGARNDTLRVRAQRAAAGAKVVLYKVKGDRRVQVSTRRLDKTGTATLSVRDRNRDKRTGYVALVRSTATTVADETPVVRVR